MDTEKEKPIASCVLRRAGKAYPRTCQVCQLGPCLWPDKEPAAAPTSQQGAEVIPARMREEASHYHIGFGNWTCVDIYKNDKIVAARREGEMDYVWGLGKIRLDEPESLSTERENTARQAVTIGQQATRIAELEAECDGLQRQLSETEAVAQTNSISGWFDCWKKVCAERNEAEAECATVERLQAERDQLRADLAAAEAKLDTILTDVSYEGGVQFWIQKHDKLLLLSASATNDLALQIIKLEREKAELERQG